MNRIQCLMGGVVLAGLIGGAIEADAHDAATTPVGGYTSVRLDGSFLTALTSLGVTPGAVGAARVYEYKGGTYAAFPVTTGSVDLAKTLAEINHTGGLSLVAGSTTVELLDFSIEVAPKGSVLTGVVTADGVFVGRIPLFDLSLGNAGISSANKFLDITNVGVKLDPKAAEALSGVFHATIPVLPVGTAEVRSVLADETGL